MPKLKKWIWLVLAIAIATTVIAAQATLKSPPTPEPESIRVDLPSPSSNPESTVSTVSSPILSVSSQNLFTHLEALKGQRYTPAARTKARNYIVRELKKYGWQPQNQKFNGGINAIAIRPGTNPELGNILVSAHFDTVANSPGADDNATGVAVALEIARLLAKYPTERSLQLAFQLIQYTKRIKLILAD